MTPAKVSNHTGAHQRRESPRAQFHLPKPRASLPTHSRSPTPRRTHAAQACKSSGAPPTQTTRQAHLGPATNSLNRACSRDGPQQRSLSRARSSPENRHRQGPLPKSPYVTTTCCQEAPQSYKPHNADNCRIRPVRQNSIGGPFSTGAVKNSPGRQLRRSTKEKIKKTSVCAGRIRWPGAGSNRRPFDLQDYGIVFVLNRYRP
jgi:hypothetical protein